MLDAIDNVVNAISGVLYKPYVVPLLEELRGQFPEADSILAAYERIEPLDSKYVPENSLIREFIGESSYHSY